MQCDDARASSASLPDCGIPVTLEQTKSIMICIQSFWARAAPTYRGFTVSMQLVIHKNRLQFFCRSLQHPFYRATFAWWSVGVD